MGTVNGLTPFKIEVADDELSDLRGRLQSARWPDEFAGAGWDYGTDQAALRSLVDRWRDGYDWRATEAELNDWGSFITTAAGQRVHLLHVPSADDGAIPLVLVHGWPGSIVEFLDVLPLLRERFHVVVFSMPGYGFSGPTTELGVDTAKVAAAADDVHGPTRVHPIRGAGWRLGCTRRPLPGRALLAPRRRHSHEYAVLAIRRRRRRRNDRRDRK